MQAAATLIEAGESLEPEPSPGNIGRRWRRPRTVRSHRLQRDRRQNAVEQLSAFGGPILNPSIFYGWDEIRPRSERQGSERH
jgi:hypothetical protein